MVFLLIRTLFILVKLQGTTATGIINGRQVFSTSFVPPGLNAGFVGLGTLGFGLADFDNVKITTADDALQSKNYK